MKKYIKRLLIAAFLLNISVSRAMADDEALAAIGGFIGGVIAGKVYDNHRSSYPRKVVVIKNKHGHSHGKYKASRCNHKVTYKTVYTREWVPGYWKVYYDRCGSRVRHWVAGYYDKIPKQIAVDCGCHEHNYGHHGYAQRRYR